MALTLEQEIRLMDRMRELKETGDTIEKLRAALLVNGVEGLFKLGKRLRTLEAIEDGFIAVDVLLPIFVELAVEEEIAKAVIDEIDCEGLGKLRLELLIEKIRPPIAPSRSDLIELALCKLDPDASGIIQLAVLKEIINPEFHPKFRSGEWSADEVLDAICIKLALEDEIKKEDLLEFYLVVSLAIEEEEDFETLIKLAFRL